MVAFYPMVFRTSRGDRSGDPTKEEILAAMEQIIRRLDLQPPWAPDWDSYNGLDTFVCDNSKDHYADKMHIKGRIEMAHASVLGIRVAEVHLLDGDTMLKLIRIIHSCNVCRAGVVAMVTDEIEVTYNKLLQLNTHFRKRLFFAMTAQQQNPEF